MEVIKIGGVSNMASTNDTSKKRQPDDTITEPTPKRLKTNFGDTIKVICGEGQEQKTFSVHKDIICGRSKYFRVACTNSRWTEAANKEVRLSHVTPEVFLKYLDWCYAESVKIIDLADELPSSLSRRGENEHIRTFFRFSCLVDLWELGDYLQDTAFLNRVMDDLVAMGEELAEIVGVMAACLAEKVCKVSAQRSGLQRWLVACAATTCHPEVLDLEAPHWSADFTTAVLRKMMTFRGRSNAGQAPQRKDSHEYNEAEH